MRAAHGDGGWVALATPAASSGATDRTESNTDRRSMGGPFVVGRNPRGSARRSQFPLAPECTISWGLPSESRAYLGEGRRFFHPLAGPDPGVDTPRARDACCFSLFS